MASRAAWETVAADGGEMSVFLDSPPGDGPRPAILVAHHRAGLDVATTKFVQDLAGLGYVAAAPDLHHRRPEGEDTRESLRRLDDAEIVRDLRAALDLVEGRGGAGPARLGVAGHCMGGRAALLAAAEIEAVRACVVYYGGNVFEPWGSADAAPFDKLDRLRGPVIGFFGGDDVNPSPDDVSRIGRRLDECGIDREFHAYDGCGHAFQNFTNPAGYRARAARESFDRMAAWLARVL